jgi:hypothetical protein
MGDDAASDLTPRRSSNVVAIRRSILVRVRRGAGMSGQWQNRMGTIRVSAMIVVLVVIGIMLFLHH